MLLAPPAILDAAVVSRPDDFWEEKLKDGVDEISEGDVIKHCQDRLPHYMSPRQGNAYVGAHCLRASVRKVNVV